MTAAVLRPSRRTFLAGGASLAALTLAGCATSRRLTVEEQPQFSEYYLQMYGPLPNEQFPVPAIELTKLDPNMFRTQVPDPTGEAPGTITTLDLALRIESQAGTTSAASPNVLTTPASPAEPSP